MSTYSERAYFDGDHCSHLAAREDHLRLKRINQQYQRLPPPPERRTGSRAR